ncbi:EthD family reductase [Natronosalvus halobius]|uniref:EthD family reductase n=1 Tax=Natronosalvus halobius TaxID=2953746 RepID=UPI00209D422C|nr:EthD family reductase [Natronosalvus halobius]USZ72323.1 EthD family reductase [Natronosalvus halobius]
MITFVNLLVRDDDLSHEEFCERWLGDHTDLASDLPGLERYVTSTPTDPSKSAYDGIVRLTFADGAAMAAAFESDVGQEVQADAATFADMEASETMVVEETVHVDETALPSENSEDD